jgi:hypothetical protein
MSNTTTRKDIKTIDTWTLRRLEHPNGDHTYTIITDSQAPAHLFASGLPNFDGRMVWTVKCSPVTWTMTLEETAEFVEQTQQALVVATEFQQAIDEAENNR